MALRAVTLTPAARRLTLTREGWRKQVETTLGQAALALREHDLETLAVIFAELDDWGEEHRAYQARRQLAELAFAAAEPLQANQWIELYLLVVGKLLDALEQGPAEPVLLNYAGVLLYEVGEIGAADGLFAAAERLDPELDHVAANRKAARTRRKRNPPRLPGHLSARARAAGARARSVADRAKPAAGLTLSLVMIVKNEEEMLPGCLDAVRHAVDEMVIVDTGSTDRTVEIAKSFGAKVVDFPWNGSFSDARNCSLEHATGDWVVYLDADEHLVPEDAPLLRRLTGRTWREAFYLVETNYTGGDDSGSSVAHLAMRMFKRKPDYRFEGRIHEQKTQAMPTYLPERFETTEIRLRHFGYLKSRISSKEKSRRNIELLEAEALEIPGPFIDFNLGSEYMALGELATSRGYLDRAWDLLRREEGWTGKGYTPMLVARVAQVRREAGDTAAARIAIDEGLLCFPDHTELVLQAGLCAKDDGKLDEAASLAERCLALGEPPTRYSATVGCGTFLAQCLLAQVRELQRRPLEAEALYAAALESHSEYIAPVLALAASMLARGVAAAEVRAAVPAEGPSARLLLATALYESGCSAEAEADFRAVLDHQPDHSVARIGLVETLLSRKAYAEAAAEAALEPEGSPLEPAAIGAELFARAASRDLGALREGLTRATLRGLDADEIALYSAWAEAIGGTAIAESLPAGSLGTARTVLEALLRVQEFEAFETLVGAYRVIAVDGGELRDGLAQIYLRRGFLESATEEWMEAYATAPEPRFLLGLAQVAKARGLDAESLELAREAARLDPNDPRAVTFVSALENR